MCGTCGCKSAETLSKTSCCCGADEANPCACMKAPEPMECSAKAPKCACYKALEKNAEFLYYYVLNEKGESPADFNTLEEAQTYVANSSEPLEIYERRSRDDEAYKMDKKMNAESFETEESYDEPSYCQNCDWEGLTSELVWDFEGRKKYGPAQCPKCSYVSYVWTGEEPAWLQAESFEAPKPKDPPYVINERKRIMTWKEIARGNKKEYDFEDWREADKQLDYLKGIHEYLEDCTDEEFEDFFTNIDDPTISNFAFDYKMIWGDNLQVPTDRDEMLNNMGDYRNALREQQQNMFPESFYDAETFEASVIRQGDAPKGAMAKAMMNKAMMEQANIEAMIQELENKVNLGLINEDELMKSLKKKFGAEYDIEELSKEDLEAYFADLKKDNPKLAKILEFNVKNEEYLPKMLIESSGYDYEILEAWNDSIIDDDKYALFDPCEACEGEGWIMTSYTPATRWDPADGDGEDCGECGGSGKIDPSDYMYYDDKGDIQYEAETKISKTCPNCEKYGRDATTDYICDFCAQCKRCCETSYGCYDVAICNDCDGSFIGKDIDGCCGSCDNCCECGDY